MALCDTQIDSTKFTGHLQEERRTIGETRDLSVIRGETAMRTRRLSSLFCVSW